MNRKYTLIRDNWNNVDTTQLEKKHCISPFYNN